MSVCPHLGGTTCWRVPLAGGVPPAGGVPQRGYQGDTPCRGYPGPVQMGGVHGVPPQPGMGYPLPRQGVPPPPSAGRQIEYLIRRGRYASCVHARRTVLFTNCFAFHRSAQKQQLSIKLSALLNDITKSYLVFFDLSIFTGS